MTAMLANYSLKNAAAVLNVSCAEDVQFDRVCADSRTLQAGDLFVALIGPNFDGHDHLQQAKQRGAVAAVVSKLQDVKLPQLKVKNTRLALAELAKARRLAFKGKVVGLTGSNGKTTVKEFIAAILRQAGKVLATQGNLNNDIGVPLTLLSLAGDENYAVIEMGANHHGEIAFLTDITKPDIALITNAGAAHLEGFGSVEGVSRAKGEIYGGLTNNGIAIVNFDDQYSEYWQTLTEKHSVIGFGIDADDAAVKAVDINQQQDGTCFQLVTPHAETEIRLSLPGLHNVRNALAAAAVAVALKLDLQKVKSALESIQQIIRW